MAKTKEKFDSLSLLASINNKKFSPLYFFYGEEDFLIEELVDAIIANAVEPSTKEFNFDILYGNEVSGKQVVALASSYPMMAERRIVIVKDIERLSDKEVLEGYCEKPSSTTVLVLLAKEPDMRRKPYPTLKKHAVGGEFSRLYDNQVQQWIEQRCKKLGYKISPEAIAILHFYVGNSLRENANELEKLQLALGEKKVIEVKDVENVVGVSREFTVFELANAVGEKNTTRAFSIVERLLQNGESAVLMITTLTRHFIILWKLSELVRSSSSDAEMAQKVGVHPFFLNQYKTHLKKYSISAIEKSFLSLVIADEKLKTVSIEVRTILFTMLTEIMS